MKKRTFLLTILIVMVFYISIPGALIYVNDYLSLPIIDNILLKIFGLLFILTDLSVFVKNSFLFEKYGKGTPIPTESPKKLVRTSLYNFSRNPIYIAHMLGLLGIYFLFGRILLLIYTIMGIIGFHILVVFIEEPHLKKKFGKDYKKYMQEVPRWVGKY